VPAPAPGSGAGKKEDNVTKEQTYRKALEEIVGHLSVADLGPAVIAEARRVAEDALEDPAPAAAPKEKVVHQVRGAFRDLNAKGKGPETFRKAWRAGAWVWVSDALPRGTFRAAERRTATRGPVEEGEIIGEFDRQLPDKRCSVSDFLLVRGTLAENEKPLRKLKWIQKVNCYTVTMPSGETIDLPDPRAH
jgi:hypothetical protein